MARGSALCDYRLRAAGYCATTTASKCRAFVSNDIIAQQSPRGSHKPKQVAIALADPVFDPQRQISAKFFWMAERLISAGLICNIGME
jgi:hypothetical protein